MPKTAIIALAALIIALASALAGIMATFADGEPQVDGHGRRLDCIPTSPANPSGPCLWTPTLTRAEVNVEFEYPYCVVKLDVETNLGELPDGVDVHKSGVWGAPKLRHVQPDGSVHPIAHTPLYTLSGHLIIAQHPDWNLKYRSTHFRYKSDQADLFRRMTNAVLDELPQTTLGKVRLDAGLNYSGQFTELKRVGNDLKTHAEASPTSLQSNAIPLSHTFAGLVDEMFTCMEVAEREEERAAERVALESQKAGLRQSLTLLKSELSRARQHELDATGILKEVIDVSEKVEEMLRTIQRVRVEGLAERRKIIDTYYSEESQRYSVFIQSLESSQAALKAADAAIAARKAELEASRAELERIVEEAQAAEADLIAEIEEAEKALGNDEE